MQIFSPEFKNNGFIPKKFSCDGLNINPTLDIFDIPGGTKSIALIMEDPDAPKDRFVHWTVWNLAPNIKRIEENMPPNGHTEGLTSSMDKGYGGPCPPQNDNPHRYFFKIYALSKKLFLSEDSGITSLEEEIDESIIEQAEIIGLYQR